MKLNSASSSRKLPETGLLALFAFEGARPSLPAGVQLPPSALDEFKGEFREARLVDSIRGPAQRVLAIGLGKKEALDAERLRRVAAIAVQRAEGASAPSCTIAADDATVAQAGGPERCGIALAEGALLGA